MVPVCYEYVCGRYLTEDELEKTIKLGWCVEIVCDQNFDCLLSSYS